MTTFVRSIALTGGILALAGIQNANAQIHNMVEFTTSFPFTVGSATIPPGPTRSDRTTTARRFSN